MVLPPRASRRSLFAYDGLAAEPSGSVHSAFVCQSHSQRTLTVFAGVSRLATVASVQWLAPSRRRRMRQKLGRLVMSSIVIGVIAVGVPLAANAAKTHKAHKAHTLSQTTKSANSSGSETPL